MESSEFLFKPYLLYNGSNLKFLCHNIYTLKWELVDNIVNIYLREDVEELLKKKSITYKKNKNELIVSYIIDEKTYNLYKKGLYYKMYVGVRVANIKNDKLINKDIIDKMRKTSEEKWRRNWFCFKRIK